MSTTWEELSDELVSRGIDKGIPLIGQFELTSRCNLQCRMCYICNSPYDTKSLSRELPARKWIELIEKARDAGMLYLLFTGGEVFIRRDFREIYEAASMMGLNIVFYTNGTLITPEIADWLGAIPPAWVEVTLYGGSGETYERVCGDYKGYNNAIRGIDLLLSKGIKLKLRTTVVKGNAHDFEKLARIAEVRDLELGIVDYISPRRDDCRNYPRGERLSPKELANYLKHVDDYYNEGQKEEIDHNGLQPVDNSFFCEASRCAFWVTWDGRMTPCGLMSQPVAYPMKNGFMESWMELREKCMKIPICSTCAGCSLRKDCICCPARLKNETGAYDKPADYLCELAKLRK